MVNSRNLINLSNLEGQSNNIVEKNVYSREGTARTIIASFFVGATVLRCPEEVMPAYDFVRPSYIQYINLDQKKEYEGLCTNIDLMKIDNLNKINKMAAFEDNWNGTGGNAFSEGAINLFISVIEMLPRQPEIAPTGRNSLLLQYELDDKSLLAFEVSRDKTEKVYIPKGDYSMAQMEVFTEDVGHRIKECVETFYGFK